MEKIGIFGGTFDPIHNLHLQIAKNTKDLLDLDRVIMVPTGNPPHKNNAKVSSFQHRYAMVQLAIKDMAGFFVSDIENKVGLKKSYTSDTLDALKGSYPNDQLYFIVGSDSLFDIETWKNPKNIFDKAVLVVFYRPNVSSLDQLKDQMRYLEKKYGGNIKLIEVAGQNMSSTEIRNDLRDGQLSNKIIPNLVEEYIKEHKLYEI